MEKEVIKYFKSYCKNLIEMIDKKVDSYGNSIEEPQNIFSNLRAIDSVKVRIDDKLSRIAKGNNEFNEDTIKDLIGYLLWFDYLNNK